MKVDDETKAIFNEVISELNKKKYGLVWEEHSEEVEDEMQTKIPVFVEDKKREIKYKDCESYNFLLEGDNLHSLKLLEKTHKNKIDVIYIDPPYNTGNKDFVYSDTIIGEDDGFRHSKWLSFMEKRLRIAKKLLKNDGVILISIDDREMSNAKLLCDDIFGANNYVETFIWIKNSGGSLSKTTLTRHEYVICYAKNIEQSYSNTFYYMEKPGYREVMSLIRKNRNTGKTIEETEKELRNYYKNNPHLKGISLYNNIDAEWNCYRTLPITAPNNQFYDVIHPKTKKPVKTPPRGWSWSKEKMEENIKNGKVLFGKDETYGISQKLYLSEAKYEHKRSTFNSDQAEGNKVLANVLNEQNAFNNPKPISLMTYLLNNMNKSSIVLDFFAGSGTTAQAVLEINKEDGGERRFIICTNNENDICEKITYPRIKTVITGKRSDNSKYSDGMVTNLKYYKTSFVNKKKDGTTPRLLLNHICELVQLENHCDINNKTIKIILSEHELDKVFKNDITNYNKLYIPTTVLLTAEQKELANENNIEIIDIPEYYFSNELREVDEI